MAFEGELVKLSNGRWARFQRCRVTDAGAYQPTVLVAVELDAKYQQMLDEVHGELLESKRAPVRMSLDPNESGELSLQVSEQHAVH